LRRCTHEINETRTFNVANEIASRVDNAVTKSPAYDANGNLTDDGVNYTFVYDAFGRLRTVKNRSNSAVVEENHYNGLNQRIGWHYDVDADGDVDGSDPWYWFIQDLRWRTVATYRVPTSWATAADSDPKERFIFHAAGVAGSGGSSYIDEVILRDRDNTSGWSTSSDGTLEERFFHLHNWRHDVIALGKSSGTLVERVKYSAYGVATRLDLADYNGDTFIDFFDDDDYDTDYTGSNAKADFDYSGTVNATDSTLWDTAYLAGLITNRGVLSTTSATTGVNNRSGYAGYQFSPATQQYHVRHRAINPLVGQWLERDPMGYHDGSDLYMYVRANPITGWDPMGQLRKSCTLKGACDVSSESSGKQIGTGMTLEDAQRCLAEALRTNPNALIYQQIQSRCPSLSIELVANSDPRCRRNVGGMSFPVAGTTTCGEGLILCYGNIRDCAELTRVLTHEMWHLYDCCQGNLPDRNTDCKECLCAELRAHRWDGGCEQGGSLRRQGETEADCLCRSSCRSCAGSASSGRPCVSHPPEYTTCIQMCNGTLDPNDRDVPLANNRCHPHSIIPPDAR
jgi:RHS repeat-associated protein